MTQSSSEVSETKVEGTNEANEAYGKTIEGLYLTGHSFERVCQRLEELLSDDGWRKCGSGYDDVNAFLDSLRLDQFRPVAEARKRIARRIKELQPQASNRD